MRRLEARIMEFQKFLFCSLPQYKTVRKWNQLFTAKYSNFTQFYRELPVLQKKPNQNLVIGGNEKLSIFPTVLSFNFPESWVKVLGDKYFLKTQNSRTLISMCRIFTVNIWEIWFESLRKIFPTSKLFDQWDMKEEGGIFKNHHYNRLFSSSNRKLK